MRVITKCTWNKNWMSWVAKRKTLKRNQLVFFFGYRNVRPRYKESQTGKKTRLTRGYWLCESRDVCLQIIACSVTKVETLNGYNIFTVLKERALECIFCKTLSSINKWIKEGDEYNKHILFLLRNSSVIIVHTTIYACSIRLTEMIQYERIF